VIDEDVLKVCESLGDFSLLTNRICTGHCPVVL
jgi:hypothetical protein